MKLGKMMAMVCVVAVGVVCASVTMGEDKAPAAPDVTATNVCTKCGMVKSKCACRKHKAHRKGQEATCTNLTDKVTCTNAAVQAISK